MLYLVLPQGSLFGWGICGKYLTKELAQLSPVNLLTDSFGINDIGNELDYIFLKSISVDQKELTEITHDAISYPVIQAITDHNLGPMKPGVKGKINIGYTFFENTTFTKQNIEDARKNFNVIATGSSWCEDVLRQHGFENCCSILQGVDRSIFNPCENHKTIFHDKFVVFSGGKLEFRKGQDLVIRAFKALQDKYDDVILVNSWFNPWHFSVQTMAASSYIHFSFDQGDYVKGINKLLYTNGIDLARVITMSPKTNSEMARIYRNTDCALFPNRCEGGTNLVLMEYMASGKPAIVSNSSGHRDVANEQNAIMLNRMKPITISQNDKFYAVWDDPDLDEIIARLEWAYNNREAASAIGEAAGKAMEKFSWKSTAKQFLHLASTPSPTHRVHPRHK